MLIDLQTGCSHSILVYSYRKYEKIDSRLHCDWAEANEQPTQLVTWAPNIAQLYTKGHFTHEIESP